MQNTTLLAIAKRLQALAQAGLYYAQEKPYDRERYEEISAMSVQILAELSEQPIESIALSFASERDGYQTPKVDIRSVIFNEEGKILMVKETVDGRWSLPGGWADVGYSPLEVAEKEAWEETGLKVKATKLIGVFDKKWHPHPPEPWYVYKIFIYCEAVGGDLAAHTQETSAVAYFGLDELPPLSEVRITKNQIEIMFDYYANPDKPAYFD